VPERRQGQSLESMLFEEVVELRGQLRVTTDKETTEALCHRIQTLETRLLVSLESSGCPLMARIMAERLRQVAQGEDP